MQFYVPSDKATPILRPSFFGPGKSVAVVNQSDEDVYMSDNPAELDASAMGAAVVGGIRIANGGGQVLWPSSATTAWFRAMMPWVAATTWVVGNNIIDKFGQVWEVTTAGLGGAAYPFPTTEPAIGTTQADGAATFTFRGPEPISLNVQPG